MLLKVLLQNYKSIDFPNPTTYEKNSEDAITMPIYFLFYRNPSHVVEKTVLNINGICMADFPTNSDILNYIYKV